MATVCECIRRLPVFHVTVVHVDDCDVRRLRWLIVVEIVFRSSLVAAQRVDWMLSDVIVIVKF